MTALQAVVALGLFSLATLAPQLGLPVARLSQLSLLLFGSGALAAFAAGALLRRLGGWTLAAACAAAVALGLAALAVIGPDAALFAVLCFGLAFGPETPASAALLSVATRHLAPAPRARVFSWRQTGNQLGAIAGSLSLPALWLLHPRLPFAVAAVLALAVALACLGCGRREVAVDTGVAQSMSQPEAPADAPAATRWFSATVQGLALAVLALSALQMSLNVFLLSHAVAHWSLTPLAAAGWLAAAQAGGLAGRLGWGWLLPAHGRAAGLIAAIGLLAAASGAALVLQPGLSQAQPLVFAVLMLALGASASGWNGLLVAEISRLAGPARAGAWSGRMLGHGYLGLTVAPLLFAWAPGGDTTAVWVGLLLLAACACVALLALSWMSVDRKPR
ncbi:MFS transporter [Sphaerotilus mobilis]|uniref:MFS transporter n=1 Tax=Sphaerotilus mobilis TaxID=47994 RepID=A0A4Q7LKL6_9BURK|nr:MFS transporter [Sphaerotilus mobilis]RZS54994.1 MFS transporter [Sphaerotilus mobilis]